MEVVQGADPGHLRLIVWLLSGLLAVMVAIIGFFITFGIGWMRDGFKKLSESFEEMTVAITGLKVTVAEIKTEFESKNPLITDKLRTHSFILQKHESRIKTLETEHNLIHKRNCGKDENYENDK
jgi:hypothetical protein